MRFRKLRNKKLEIDNDLAEWLGETLLSEGNRLLNNSPSKADLIIRFLIAQKNWLLSMQEIGELEKEIKKLEVQINILRGD